MIRVILRSKTDTKSAYVRSIPNKGESIFVDPWGWFIVDEILHEIWEDGHRIFVELTVDNDA